MFEGPVYSKRVIMNFTTTLAKFEEVLKFIELFDGMRILFSYIFIKQTIIKLNN